MRRSQKEYLRSTKEWLSLDKRLGLYLFLLALLIRFSYLFLIGDHYLLESGDQSAYEGIALKYAQDKGFMPGPPIALPFIRSCWVSIINSLDIPLSLLNSFRLSSEVSSPSSSFELEEIPFIEGLD